MLRFYDRISHNDASAFDQLISDDPATLVIGTVHDEWVTERERLRFGFEAEALSIEPGAEPTGYAEGDLGWFVDRPVYVFGDLRVAVRLTSVLRREGGRGGSRTCTCPSVCRTKRWASSSSDGEPPPVREAEHREQDTMEASGSPSRSPAGEPVDRWARVRGGQATTLTFTIGVPAAWYSRSQSSR